jgi:2-C-methyl-D-erythritol 4-phosphate cytidylyltransferase
VIRLLAPQALGVVPCTLPEASWTVGGVPLVRRAVTALLGSGRVGAVLVPVRAAHADAITELLRDLDGERVRLIPDVAATALPAALDAHGPELVVVHDALHPLASAELVRAVVDAASAQVDVAGAVAVRPVTDTLKWVDVEGVITGTADREGYRVICSPQAYRVLPFRAAVERLGALGELDALASMVGRSGRLVTVPAPQEVFKVADVDDLELAEAVLAASAQGSR